MPASLQPGRHSESPHNRFENPDSLRQGSALGTIGVNITGSFVVGFFGTLTLTSGRHPLPETARLFVMVGLCGGFTTFSFFSLQTLELLRSGAWNRALFNITLSVLSCLAAVAVGHGLAAWPNGGAQQVAQNMTEEEAG